MKKRIITAILMMCMALCFVACGGNGSDKDSQKPSTEDTTKDDSNKDDSEKESEESGIVYTIKVVDENNNPIGGMMVQICKDTCMPKLTNAQGVAEFSVAEKSDDYYAGITSLPEGYTYEGEEKVYFENGTTEVVFVITSEK